MASTVSDTLSARMSSAFSPEVLQVINESHMHSGPADAESHFKLIIVSALFAGESKVSRHRRVYAELSDLMPVPLHALAIHAFTPDEWQGAAPDSPRCAGGH